MSTGQLLPKYADKEPLEPAPPAYPTPQHDEQTPPPKKSKKVILRKVIVFSFITWLVFHLLGGWNGSSKGRGGPSWNGIGMDVDEMRFDLDHAGQRIGPVSAPEVTTFVPYEDSFRVDTVNTAEATLKLDDVTLVKNCRGRARFTGPILTLDVPAQTKTEILVSRNDVDVPQVTVESYSYTDLEGMTVHKSEDEYRVDVPAQAESHTINLVLPLKYDHVPPLQVRSGVYIPIKFDSSAASVKLSTLVLKSPTIDHMPEQLEAEMLSVNVQEGDIRGKFNVTRGINLHAVTGSIDAEIFVHRLERNGTRHEHSRSWLGWMSSHGDKPHGRQPHGPPPPFIHAETATGDVRLTIHQPLHLGTVTKALTHTGDLVVNGAKTFRGMFKAGTHVGDLSVKAEGNKTVEVIKQDTKGPGAWEVGFIKFNGEGNHTRGRECPMTGKVEEWYRSMYDDKPHEGHGHGDHGHPGHGDHGHGPFPAFPPPGFSKLIASTDVGSIALRF